MADPYLDLLPHSPLLISDALFLDVWLLQDRTFHSD